MVREKWTGWMTAVLTMTVVIGVHFFHMPPTQAQLSPLAGDEASVVVDGNIIFTVKDTEKFTADERAEHINKELLREVIAEERATIRVDDDVERNEIYLRSLSNDDILITVTEADVTIPGGDRREQADDWAEKLQAALRQGQQERRPTYRRQATLYSAVVLGVAIILHLIFWFLSRTGYRYLGQWLEYSAGQFKEWEKPIKLFWHLGSFVLKAGLWVIVAFYLTDIFPEARMARHAVFKLLSADIIQLGDVRYSPLNLIRLVIGTVILWFGTNLLTYLFRTYVLNQARLEQRIQDILSVVIQYALIFLGVVILLQVWGIDASSLTILASVLGVGIGFGVQNITNNFISGFIITLEQPIQVGDFINVGDREGTVIKIGARSTELRTLDQVTIIIPNSRFLESEVINWNHGNSVSRLRIPIGVAYGSDIPLVKKALLSAVRKHPEVLLRPKPDVFFQGFGDSALNFEVFVWTGEPRKQSQVRSDLNYEIEASLRRHQIEIPFPQRDLHLRSPQLEALVGILKHSMGVSAPGEETTDTDCPDTRHSEHIQPSNQPSPSSSPESLGLDPAPLEEQEAIQSNVSPDLDLESLAAAMQGQDDSVEGVLLRDRSYGSQTYPACFTGTGAVKWLVHQGDYTREDALLIGQWLLQQGFIHRVMEDPESERSGFEDGDHFYQFQRNPSPAEQS